MRLSFHLVGRLLLCRYAVGVVSVAPQPPSLYSPHASAAAPTFGLKRDERLAVAAVLDKLQHFASVKFADTSSSKNKHESSSVQRQGFLGSPTLSSLSDRLPTAGLFANRRLDQEAGTGNNLRYFEGDIVLFEGQARQIYDEAVHGDERRQKRKFIGPTTRRWDTSRQIEYSFDGSHTSREQRIIELALEHWSNITCLEFARRHDSPRGNRIVFTDVDGCASNVGRHPLGEPQYVSLAPECMRLGVIAHEVAHALGFWHEQSRPDRDQFVTVQWSNVDVSSKGQFLKEQRDDVDSARIPYDYGSIMHYRSKAFAQFDDLYTIKTNIPAYQRTIGQRDQLSFNDVRLMNSIYCARKCHVQLPCQRGGYTDPRRCDRCRCPDGFTGIYCDQVMEGLGGRCGGVISVRREWRTALQSPGYPQAFKEGQECSWLLQAPPGMHVQLQFVGTFDLYCKARHSLCMDYVEVRNSTDFANTGMRFCCYGTPSESIFSATGDMLLLFRSFYRAGRGFQARARAVEARGSWSAWSSWSLCTASCGGCGTQKRSRSCTAGQICRGDMTETRSCNHNVCDLCAVTRYVTAPCGGFLGLLRGIQCKVYASER